MPHTGASLHVSASVILCTRNRAAQLQTALEALATMRLSEEVKWEVLIVDNGSTDATRDIVGQFIRDGYSRFRYLYEPSPGKTYALNTGIYEAHGEILAFTDDDAIVEPNWLAAIIAAFQRHSADGIGGKVLPIWQAKRPTWLSDSFLNVLALLNFGDEAFRIDWKEDPKMLYGVNYAFRKVIFERLGNFNTILGSRGEDQELFDRLAAADARVFYDPSVVVRHVISGDRLTKRYYREWYRASGLARAKLAPSVGRSLFGIPLYSLRSGFATLGGLFASALTCDKEGFFTSWLRLNYFAAYYLGRIRIALSRTAGRSC